jgi:hypothetical protein
VGVAGCNLRTCRLACVVTVAVVAALLAPCLAYEEGESLRVLGDVGDNAVLADAGVCELVRVARVLVGGHGGDAGLLETDEGALGLVLLAPVVWGMSAIVGWRKGNAMQCTYLGPTRKRSLGRCGRGSRGRTEQ